MDMDVDGLKGSDELPTSLTAVKGHHVYEEENKDTEVIERAIDIFLHTAEKHCTNRDVTKANKALSKAMQRAKKLGEQHPKVQLIGEHKKRLSLHMKLLPLFSTEPFSFVVHFVAQHKPQSNALVYQGFYGLVRLIRTKVFCTELGIPKAVEFDEREDTCVHIIAKMGDAPVAYCRYWIYQHERPNANWVVLDRLCTLPSYRGRGFAKACLNYAQETLGEIRHSCIPPINIAVFHVPSNQQRFKERLEREGFYLLNDDGECSELRTFQQGRHQRLSCFHLVKPLSNVDEATAKHDMNIARTLTVQQEELIKRRGNLPGEFPAFVEAGNSCSKSTKRSLNT